MSKYVFLFDLDSTVTRQEIFPTISRELGVYEAVCSLTESTMRGEIPFKQNFLQRVELLKKIPVGKVCNLVSRLELNQPVAEFIKKNKERCYIVTVNLDVWIEGLVEKLEMGKNVFCSKALVRGGYIQDVYSVIDKNAVVEQMAFPCVAIGDGNNDAKMIEEAKIGVGFGGVRDIAPSVLACATHAVYDVDKLVEFLERLL